MIPEIVLGVAIALIVFNKSVLSCFARPFFNKGIIPYDEWMSTLHTVFLYLPSSDEDISLSILIKRIFYLMSHLNLYFLDMNDLIAVFEEDCNIDLSEKQIKLIQTIPCFKNFK